MRIAIDAMGGDFAPRAIVEGVVRAAHDHPGTSLVLVGRSDEVERELARHGARPSNIDVLHAGEVVEMGESPAVAIRRKKDSSISRSVELVKSGEASALFSAGSTGAAVAASILKLRSLPGVSRPAIATVFPTRTTPFLLLDVGATIDCSGEMIAQFGVMGAVYAREILGVKQPRVGLLSIGGEDAKGNEATKTAFRILGESRLNFVGNVESRDLFEGKVDVAACDGFVGNVVLKTSEAVAGTIGRWFREEFTRNLWRKIGAGMLYGAIKELRRKADPETYGGAPLLGANGIVIIGHGSSSPHAVRNAIGFCLDFRAHHVNDLISSEIQELVNSPGREPASKT